MTKTPQLETTTQKFIDDLAAANNPPIYTLSYAEARKVLENAQSNSVKNPTVSIEDLKIPEANGLTVSVSIFRPAHNNEILPMVMYYHGGGWVLGSKHTHERLVAELAVKTKAAIIFVNYTASPEAQFPLPLEQAYTATKYMVEHAKKFKLDANRLAVAGDSVGGNMAIAMTLLAKERKEFSINYQVLFYPVTNAEFNTTSYNEFADGPWLTKAAMQWFWDAYAPNVNDRKKIIASPLNATQQQLADLPAALIITAANDVLRDEGEAYAVKLMQAKVEVTAVRYLGTTHDFVMLNALADTPAAKSAIDLAANQINNIFNK